MSVLLTLSDRSLVDDAKAGVAQTGMDAVEAPSLAGALALVQAGGVAIVVVDDGWDATEVSALLRATRSDRVTSVLQVLTGEWDPEPLEGVSDVIAAPIDPDEMAMRLVRMEERHQERLKGAREVMMAIAAESAGDIIEITDSSAVIQWVNPAFERILGYSAADAIGKTPGALIRSDMHEPEFFREIDRTLSAGEVWQGVLMSRAKDGRIVYLESTISPVRNKAGVITNHVACKRDMTDHIEAESTLRDIHDELVRARDRALEASHAKSQFLANMSHELRTPLNAIIGYSEMLSEDVAEIGRPGYVDDLKKISRAGEHLLLLINDVLDISKIEAGKMELYLETFDVGPTIESLAASFLPDMRSRGNTLEIDCPADLGVMRADVTKLRQALMNLLSNANKFTDQGTIRLTASTEPTPTGSFLVVSVSDTGIGMTPEQVDRAFLPFEQGDASTTRRYGGTGLGLAISQRFCEMMGGGIAIESEENKGSTFTVRLPIEVVDPSVSRRRSSHATDAQHTVLVVDDDPTVHDLVIRALSKHPFRVECVSSGPDGIALAKTLKPDVIVLDVMMPGMDGWSVMSELKRDSDTGRIPIVMLSMLEQSDMGYALGAVDYLVKPVNGALLVETISKWCVRRGGTVLVVEDDEATREMVRRTLQRHGYVVQDAENGRVALELLRTFVPDAIVLDLMMPEMDGFAFLEAMHGNDKWAGVPVIVTTARSLEGAERAWLKERVLQIVEKGAYSRGQLLDVVASRVREASRTSMTPPQP